MKILEIKTLAIPEIKVIKFARFCDNRGYFTEQFRKSDFANLSEIESLKNSDLVQANQSFSKKGTIRGLHFQWNPYMGKLARTITGHMIDIVLDIRKGSPTFGKAIMYNMQADNNNDYDEWIWIPAGFARGNFYKEDSIMEYYCSGEYNQNCEAGISPLALDIDWSLCDIELKKEFDQFSSTNLITEKDKGALSITDWVKDDRSNNFIYNKI